MTERDRYRLLCDVEPTIPFFSRAWWLDAVAGANNWDVVIIEEADKIVAALPFMRRVKYGKIIFDVPPLTQSLGPWFAQIEASESSRISREKHLMKLLIDALPQYDYFKSIWNFERLNWLPFYWAGFHQTTYYTYRLNDLSDHDRIWRGFRNNIKGDIKKAERKFGLRVRSDASLKEFIPLHDKSFFRQGLNSPYSESLLNTVDCACVKNGARKIFLAEDPLGRPHAAVYLVWDSKNAYYLMGGSDQDLRGSGAVSLCLWEAIKFASAVTESFDFEGSMMENIERFFRAFGAHQTPYFVVSHAPSRWISMALFMRDFLRRVP